MTANQVYKLSGSKTPFSEWVGEQKTKYGNDFIANEEFLNANGSGFGGTSDENIEYPTGAGISTQVNLGKTSAQAGIGVKNIMPVVVLVGAIVVAGYFAKRYMK